MVIKISVIKKKEKEKFLNRFKQFVLPNGDQIFLFSQIDTLVCTASEEERNRFISNLEVHLGKYSFLKEEVKIYF